LSKYKVGETLLYVGIHVTIFLFSCGLVGYGIEKGVWNQIPNPLYPEFPYLDHNLKVGVIWILGIFGMIAGLLGIIDVIKALITTTFFKRKHSMRV